MTTNQRRQAVTANRLTDGAPVYLTRDADWSTSIADAAHLTDAASLLAEAQATGLHTVAPYLIDVEIIDGAVQPVGLREQIRAFGPTA